MSATQYREVGMLCAIAWGTVDVKADAGDKNLFQNIRRQVRLEMRHNKLQLIAWATHYRLLVRNGNSRKRRRVVLCTGDLKACCWRAIEYLGVTQGGNDVHG
jgi:hypothetical protein